MAEKSGYEQPPPYSAGNTGFSNQYGADFGPGYPKSDNVSDGAYPPAGGAYPQAGGAYPQAGGAYPQPGYGQAYSHQTTAVIVSQPGVAGAVIVRPRPPDYMLSSVIACLCCFWPTGLCAIYFASQANSLAAQGDMEGATRMSNNARNLMISSIVIGVIWITLVIVLRVVVYSSTYNRYDY